MRLEVNLQNPSHLYYFVSMTISKFINFWQIERKSESNDNLFYILDVISLTLGHDNNVDIIHI